MNELYIDNKLVDLGDDTKVGITLQVNNIAEMEDRQGNFSNTFKTVKSKTNKSIYEHAEIVNSATTKPYKKLAAKYVQDGIELIPAGYCEFKSAGDFYEQTLFSGILDFFNQIKGKKLSDLDLSAYDHVWNLANIFGSRVNTDGYIYPIIDFSDDQAYINNVARTIDVRTLFPAMFIHTLIEKIFEGTTYTLDGNITTLAKYKKRLFPYQLDQLKYPDDFISKQLFKVRIKKNVTYTIPMVYTSGVNPTRGHLFGNQIMFNDETSQGYFDNPQKFSTILGQFEVPTTGSYIFTCESIISMNTANPVGTAGAAIITNKAVLAIYKNGGLIAVDQIIASNFNSSALPVASPPTVCQKGDIILVKIDFDCNSSFYNDVPQTISNVNPTQTTVIIHSNTKLYNSMSNVIQFNGQLFMSSLMGDMLQTDLLKAIANQLAIIFIPDNVKKIIHFKQFNELYANKPNAIDMTDKLDMGTEIKVSFRETNYAQKNYLKYKEDKTNTVQGYGDGFFYIADENLEQEKTLFTLPFAASEDVTRLIGLKVVKIPKLHAGAFVNKTEPRIIMLNLQNITGGNLVYDDTVSTLQSSASIPLTYFIDDAKDDSIGFDRFLITQEWNNFVNNMMNNYKKVDGNFKLSIKDVHNFDFFKPWYLGQYSNYFYVNAIKDFIKGKKTNVTLIKM